MFIGAKFFFTLFSLRPVLTCLFDGRRNPCRSNRKCGTEVGRARVNEHISVLPPSVRSSCSGTYPVLSRTGHGRVWVFFFFSPPANLKTAFKEKGKKTGIDPFVPFQFCIVWVLFVRMCKTNGRLANEWLPLKPAPNVVLNSNKGPAAHGKNTNRAPSVIIMPSRSYFSSLFSRGKIISALRLTYTCAYVSKENIL